MNHASWPPCISMATMVQCHFHLADCSWLPSPLPFFVCWMPQVLRIHKSIIKCEWVIPPLRIPPPAPLKSCVLELFVNKYWQKANKFWAIMPSMHTYAITRGPSESKPSVCLIFCLIWVWSGSVDKTGRLVRLLLDEISVWSDNYVCRTRSQGGPPHFDSSQVTAWMQLIQWEETVMGVCVYMA